jgi:hypothetical protein
MRRIRIRSRFRARELPKGMPTGHTATMRKITSIALSAVLLLCAAGTRASEVSASQCGDQLTRSIPPRPTGAPTGSDFAHRLSGLDGDERENAIQEQLVAGNIPEFLRHLAPVRLTGHEAGSQATEVTVCVSPDYLAVGSDQDFFLVPMRLRTALAVANQFRFELPTPRMVDAIYAQAAMRLNPQPLPASDAMRTTAYYWEHNEIVQQQRTGFASQLGILTAGDKKDLVLTNRLWRYPDRVAIYGWHRQDGTPIQPLSTVHGARYADYSHGVRLVSATAYIRGKAVSLLNLLQNPQVAGVLSDEGRVQNAAALINTLSARYPPLAQAVRASSRNGR